jgi:hypothetical protein
MASPFQSSFSLPIGSADNGTHPAIETAEKQLFFAMQRIGG